MTKVQNLDVLQATGQARPVPMTRQQLLESVSTAMTRHGTKEFKTLRDVEDMDPQILRNTPTAGTVFAAIEQHLGSLGMPTNGTVGGLMDTLALTQDHVHHVACFCHENSDTMDGITAGHRLGDLAEGNAG